MIRGAVPADASDCAAVYAPHVLAGTATVETGSGCRALVAVIGDSANAASIGGHASRGFVRAGLLTAAGFKFGRWLDVVSMQRSLG